MAIKHNIPKCKNTSEVVDLQKIWSYTLEKVFNMNKRWMQIYTACKRRNDKDGEYFHSFGYFLNKSISISFAYLSQRQTTPYTESYMCTSTKEFKYSITQLIEKQSPFYSTLSWGCIYMAYLTTCAFLKYTIHLSSDNTDQSIGLFSYITECSFTNITILGYLSIAVALEFCFTDLFQVSIFFRFR